MALPPRFTSRTVTTVTQQAPRRIDTRSVPAGISVLGRAGAEGVELNRRADQQVEASQQRMAEAEARRDRNLETIKQGARLTEIEAEAASAIGELEAEPELFAEGHVEKVERVLAERRARYIEGLPRDEEIRARATAQYDAYAARTRVRAETFAASRRVKDQGTLWEQSGSVSNGLLFDDPSPENFVALLDQDAAMVAQMDIGEGDKEALYNARGRERAQALLSGLLERGEFDQVDALRKSDLMKPFLTYEISQRYRGLAERGRQMVVREAELAEKAAADAVRLQIENAEELIKQGATNLEVPVETLLASARAAKLEPAEITELEGMALGLRVNARYDNAGELTSHIRQMEAMDRAGTLQQDGQRSLFYMRQRLDTLATERAAEFEEGWDAGGKQRTSAVAAMFTLPAVERIAAAEKLDPTGNLKYAVQLPSQNAQAVVRGQELRKLKQGNPLADADTEAMFEDFEELTGDILNDVNPTTREAMFEMALDIMADHMDRRAVSEYGRKYMRGAIGMVLGSRMHPGAGRVVGGLGEYRGAPVWLPPAGTQETFEATLRAQSFEGAAEPKEVILRHYRPRAMVEGAGGAMKYRFVDESGDVLMKADGSGFYETWIGGAYQ